MAKIPTGIPGFDVLIEGGFPKGNTTLLAGPTGSGKTIFAMQFLYNGATQFDENGVFITLETRPNDLRAEALEFGWDIADLERSGKICIIDAASSKAGLPTENATFALKRGFDMEALAESIYKAIETTNARRLVLDSISGLMLRFNEQAEVRRELHRISALLNELKVTSIFIGEVCEPNTHGHLGVEQFVTQGLVTMNITENNGSLERDLLIWKMRFTSHSMKRHKFEINKTGIYIKANGTKSKGKND